MRLKDIISEAPLADYQVHSAPDTDMDPKRPSSEWPNGMTPPSTDSFHRQIDRKLIQHPKTKATIEKYLKTSAFDLHLFFYNDKHTVTIPDGQSASENFYDPSDFFGKVEPDTDGGSYAVTGGHDWKRIAQWFPHLDLMAVAKALKPYSVVVIHRHNDYDGMELGAFPMTPWMILHRTVHVLLKPNRAFRAMEVPMEIYKNRMIGLLENVPGAASAVLCDTRYVGTTRTFRDKTVGQWFDQATEFVCQYLATGKVTLKSPFDQQTPDGKPCLNFLNADAVDEEFTPEGVQMLRDAGAKWVKEFEEGLNAACRTVLWSKSIHGLYVV